MTNRDIHESPDQPKGGDERAFKAKHKVKVTDHPEGTKLPPITTSKKKRLADPVDTEATYEDYDPKAANDKRIASNNAKYFEKFGKSKFALGTDKQDAKAHKEKAKKLNKKAVTGAGEDDKVDDKAATPYEKTFRKEIDKAAKKKAKGPSALTPYEKIFGKEEVETSFSIFWRDVNGMDKQKHGLSEEEVTRLASALEAAGSVKIFIDEEQMTDEQMKKRERYVKGMKSKDDDLRKRYGKRWKDVMYAIATKNAMREEVESLDEIAKSEEEPLHVQLRKRTNANEVSLTFKNGKTHVVSRGQANKALTMLSAMKPADRQHAHAEMSKSHEHFMDALDGKIAKSGKTGISLAGPKMKNEEVESLDEVGVPPTKYGGKPQPAPQPVSRPAPKPPEKKTATATTVKEAGDVIPPKSPKMKSLSGGFKLDKPRTKYYDVPTQKDRSLEDDG